MNQSARYLSLAAAAAVLVPGALLTASPIDPNPTVVSGQVAFEGLQGNEASILQQSQRAIVDYTHFNIVEGGSVTFVQPSADATILNRITGADPSMINGAILANGQVYFVNPAGVTFGPNSVVRADMFMAIAGDITNANFLDGNMQFNLTGTVDNQGYIEAQRGVALLGRQVKNTGEIVAKDGFAILASGDEILLQPKGTSLAVQISDAKGAEAAEGAGVENLGSVDGEEIMFSAGDAFATAIRHKGSAKASKAVRLHTDGGRIEVSGEIAAKDAAGGGLIEVGGTDQGGPGAPSASSVLLTDTAVLDASADVSGDGGHVVVWSDGLTEMYGAISATGADGGSGGFAEVSGKEVVFAESWSLMLGSGGEFLLDPTDVVIDAVLAGTIISQMSSGAEVTVTTAAAGADQGDITVSSPINVLDTFNQGRLVLSADRDIIINADITSAQPINAGTNLFQFTAGGNIAVNAMVRAGTNNSVSSRGAVVLNAAGSVTLGDSMDSAAGPMSITAGGDVTLAAGQQLLAGGTGSVDNLLSIIAPTGKTTFAGGNLLLFNDTNLYIQTAQFVNQTGSALVGGGGTGSWNIALPHPLGRTSISGVADQHQFGALNSLNPAQYGSTGNATVPARNEYHFTYVPSIDITANNFTKTYGNDVTGGLGTYIPDTSDLVDASAYGSVFTQDTLSSSVGGTASLVSIGSASTADVTTYPIEVSGLSSPNGYAFNYIDGTLTVNQRPITLTANQQSKIYGDTLTLDTTAFMVRDLDGDATLPNSETINEVSVISAINGDTNTDVNAATYSGDLSIDPDTGTLVGSANFDPANYAFTYQTGNLVVNPRAINVIADPQDKFFGDIKTLSDTAFTVEDKGVPGAGTLPNGDAITAVAVNSKTGKDASTISDVDTYAGELEATGVTGNGGFILGNYDISFIDGDFQITPRPVTLTANDQVKDYGDALALGTAAFTIADHGLTPPSAPFKLPNGETIDAVSLQSVTGVDGSTTANVGTYAGEIEITGQTGGNGFKVTNYDLTYVDGSLEVMPRAVTLTASKQEKIYGDVLLLSNTAFTVLDKDGDAVLPNGEAIDTVNLASLGGNDASTTANAGLYVDDLEISGQAGSNGFAAGNYDLTYVKGDLEVNPREVILTATQQDKTYGDPLALNDTAFTILDKDGDALLPNGEMIDTVNLVSATGVDASTTANAGLYADEIGITGQNGSNGFLASNYDLSYVAGDLEVLVRAITLTATQQEKIYGDTLVLDNTAFTVLDKDGDALLPNGETVDTVSLVSAGGIDASTNANVGTYTDDIGITGQAGSGGFLASNYDLTYVDGNLVVNPRAVTLTATQQDKIYGDPLTLDPTAFTVLDKDGDAALPNGELVDTVDLVSAGGIDASTTANVGTYTDDIGITGQNGSNGFLASNYVLTYVDGDLVVSQRAVTLTATRQDKIYGDPLTLDNTAFTVLDKDGDAALPNGELVDTVDLVSAGGIDASTTANVGTYTDDIGITGQNGSNGFLASNYALTYVDGDLVVNQRAVTLTATRQDKIYGDPLTLDPTAFTVLDKDGDAALPNGELVNTVDLVSAGGIDASTTANVGTYTDDIGITGQNGSNGFLASNYALTYVDGDLVVNQRAVTLTATQQDKIYGDLLTLDPTAFTVLDKDGDAALPNGELVNTVDLVSAGGIDASTTANVGTYSDDIGITGQNGSNGFLASNYDLTYVDGDLVITQRAVTLTATKQDKTYGDPLALDSTAFTVLDKDGNATLPNGETVDTVNLVSATGVDASTTANVGTYTDEIGITGQSGSNGFLASNYDLTYVAGDLEVLARAMTLTASQQGKTYGDPLDLDHTAFTVLDKDGDAALPNGETVDTVNLVSSGGIDASTTANVGTYADDIRITGQNGSNGFVAGNYQITYVDGDLVVSQRAMTLTASQQDKIYGDPLTLDNTAFTVLDKDGDAGLPNGETVDTVNLLSATGVDASTSSNVGTYADEIGITGQNGSNGFQAGNYQITYVDGDLVVNQRALTLTALQQDRGYGTAMIPDPTAFAVLDKDGDAALPNGEMVDALTLLSIDGLAGDPAVFPGRYPENIVPIGQAGSSGFVASNYDITYVAGDLLITGFPPGTVLMAEGAFEDYADLFLSRDVEKPFGLSDPPSQSATLSVFGFPEWAKLSMSQRLWVMTMIDRAPDEKITEEYMLYLINEAQNAN